MTKTNGILSAWLALFCAIFWASYLFGNTAPWFDNVTLMVLIGLWGMGNALITAYPALSFIYLFTLVKRTIRHTLVIAGIIAFVWGFYPWLIPVEVGSGITMVMLLIWSTLFLVYRPAKTFLLKIEGAPAWVMDNKEMSNKKTPYGWVEVIEMAKFNQPASTWFGERHHVIIPIYWGMSDEAKQAISQYAAQLKQADQVYLGLFVDDVFEKGQKLLGFQTKPNSYLDDIESWLLHLLKNANTKAKKEQLYLFGASIKQLMPTMQELGDPLNPSGILFFAAPKTHSPLAQLANRVSFSQWQIDGAQAGLASVNHAISTIEQPKQYPTRLLLKPALVQAGAVIILALPLIFLMTKPEIIPPDMKYYEDLFYVGIHEITAGQYQECMAENACEEPIDCDDRGNKSWKVQEEGIDLLLEKHTTKPMGCLSVTDAIDYVNWRSEKEALSVCYDENASPKADCTGYRIPTKTEWEKLVTQKTATTSWQPDWESCVDEKWGCEVSLESKDQTAAGIKFLFTNAKEIVRNDDNNRYEAVGGSWIAKTQRQPSKVMTRPLRLRNVEKRYNDVGLRVIRSVVHSSEEE